MFRSIILSLLDLLLPFNGFTLSNDSLHYSNPFASPLRFTLNAKKDQFLSGCSNQHQARRQNSFICTKIHTHPRVCVCVCRWWPHHRLPPWGDLFPFFLLLWPPFCYGAGSGVALKEVSVRRAIFHSFTRPRANRAYFSSGGDAGCKERAVQQRERVCVCASYISRPSCQKVEKTKARSSQKHAAKSFRPHRSHLVLHLRHLTKCLGWGSSTAKKAPTPGPINRERLAC